MCVARRDAARSTGSSAKALPASAARLAWSISSIHCAGACSAISAPWRSSARTRGDSGRAAAARSGSGGETSVGSMAGWVQNAPISMHCGAV